MTHTARQLRFKIVIVYIIEQEENNFSKQLIGM
jgi:hypothetical protein